MASLISVGQVLDRSAEHVRKHYVELLAIVLWMVAASIPTIIGKLLSPLGGDKTLVSGDWVSFAFSLSGAILVVIASFWMYATLTFAMAHQAKNQAGNVKRYYREGWKVLGKYILLSLTLGAIFTGLVLISAPGLAMLLFGASAQSSSGLWTTIGVPVFFLSLFASFYLIVKYTVGLAFSPFLLLLEKRPVVEAITGSLKLVQGRWWSTAVRFVSPKVVYFLAFFIITFVSGTALKLLTTILASTSHTAVLLAFTLSLFLSVFLSVIVTPFILATDYYLYDSLRNSR